MKKIIEAENLKDTTRSNYEIDPDDYIEAEKELIMEYARNRITKSDYIKALNDLYVSYVSYINFIKNKKE